MGGSVCTPIGARDVMSEASRAPGDVAFVALLVADLRPAGMGLGSVEASLGQLDEDEMGDDHPVIGEAFINRRGSADWTPPFSSLERQRHPSSVIRHPMLSSQLLPPVAASLLSIVLSRIDLAMWSPA